MASSALRKMTTWLPSRQLNIPGPKSSLARQRDWFLVNQRNLAFKASRYLLAWASPQLARL